MTPTTTAPPEHNVTGIDYGDRRHFRYAGPLIDIHTHVFQTRPGDPKNGPPLGTGPGASLDQADAMLAAAREFGIVRTYSMCPPDDIPPLRERFGDQLGFNGSISKKLDEPDEAAYQLLDRFLELGVEMIKFWAAPRGRERGLLLDTPWRIEAARRARAAGIRVIMVHVADPDAWFRTVYADAAKFGTKAAQYAPLERMLEMFPDMVWIAAHLGGDPEHPDHLEALLERYPHLHFDTSATKWQVREVSRQREAIRRLLCRYPDRFLFGTDLVTRHELPREHYISRYWCQRTLWESPWEGPSPIADPDYQPTEGEPALPLLRGLALPEDVLRQVYHVNACRLLHLDAAGRPKLPALVEGRE
ncbi:MAG TPA: amidohydrolase family protein [Gemmataceae bacterium]|nr:amidohydrolase family protein [Gemmataceae bacterium]